MLIIPFCCQREGGKACFFGPMPSAGGSADAEDAGQTVPVGQQLQVLTGDDPQGQHQDQVDQRRRGNGPQRGKGVAKAREEAVAEFRRHRHGGGERGELCRFPQRLPA